MMNNSWRHKYQGCRRGMWSFDFRSLICAIREQNLGAVKECVERGVDINYTSPLKFSNSALTEAVIRGNAEIAEYLISKGANVNSKGPMNCTPLLAAIKENAPLNIVTMLVDKGANVNDMVNMNGDTPLTLGIRLRNFPLVEFLISRGADVNKIGGSGMTPLSLAVTTYNLPGVKILLENGADPAKTNQDGNSAFELARRLNLGEIVTLLGSKPKVDMQRARSVNSFLRSEREKNNDEENRRCTSLIGEEKRSIAINKNNEEAEGCTLLGKAILSGNLNEIEHLISIGVDTCKVGADGKSPLLLAVQCKNLTAIKLLLENGANLTIPTAFLESINLNNTEIVTFFLEKRVRVNLIYRNGCTPLTKAAENQNFGIVRALIAKNADVNMVDSYGDSPLLISLKNLNTQITRFLISKGAKMDEQFLEENNFENLKLLSKLGVKLKDVLKEDHSLLVKAIQMGNLKVVKYLVEQGIKIDQTDDDNKTPLAVAALSESFGIVKYLIEAGASVKLALEQLKVYAAKNEDFEIYFQSLKIKM